MKTVLSIDFSIVMANNLPLVNRLVQEFYGIQNQLDYSPILNFLPLDLNIYESLTEVLYNQWSQNKDIKTHLVHGQEDTIHFLKEIKKEGEECRLIHIDYFPDLEEYTDYLNNANWVKYAIDNNLIDELIWIKDKDSSSELSPEYDIDTSLTIQNVIFDLLPKADEIVISSSLEWILPKDEVLLSLWEFLYKKLTGNTEFVYEEYQDERDLTKSKQ